jgi:hypothetical protein
MKKLFLIAVLVVSANIAFAQDKYEFMTINYSAIDNIVGISIDGKEFLTEKTESSKGKHSYMDTNPILLKLKEYQDKGWEIMSFNSGSGSYNMYFAYLRKKKN